MKNYHEAWKEIWQLENPGVYIFINKELNVFYVGKTYQRLRERISNHLSGNSTKESIKKLTEKDNTALYVIRLENQYSNNEEFDKYLKKVEYATYEYFIDKGYESLNSMTGFESQIREEYENYKEVINVEKMIDFTLDLFKIGIREFILSKRNNDENIRLSQEIDRIKKENFELKNKIKQDVNKNSERIKKALKLYINVITSMGKLDELVLVSGCNIEKIIEQVSNGRIDASLVDGINMIINVDSSILFGERELSIIEENVLLNYSNERDEDGFLKSLYDVTLKTNKVYQILRVGGYDSIDLIKNSIKNKIIPARVKWIYENLLKVSWGLLKGYSYDKLVLLFKERVIEANKNISTLDIFIKNGIVDQMSSCMYRMKQDEMNNSSKLGDVISCMEISKFDILRIFNRENFNRIIEYNALYKNFIVVNELNNYRFEEVRYVDEVNNYSKNFYVILDFNDTDKEEDDEYAKYIYEVSLDTFYYYTSRITSINYEANSEEDKAKMIKELEETIMKTIEYNKKRMKLIEKIQE